MGEEGESCAVGLRTGAVPAGEALFAEPRRRCPSGKAWRKAAGGPLCLLPGWMRRWSGLGSEGEGEAAACS